MHDKKARAVVNASAHLITGIMSFIPGGAALAPIVDTAASIASDALFGWVDTAPNYKMLKSLENINTKLHTISLKVHDFSDKLAYKLQKKEL